MPAFRNGAVYLSVSLSAVVLGVVPSPSQPPESSELPLVDVVAKVDRSLVNVVAGPASASGFVFSETRWIVTNRHVVAEVGQGGSVKIRPVLPPQEGRSKLGPEIDATVRMLHPDLDLAVLEILPPIPSEIQAISMVASSLLPRGTEVLIHGFPATSVPTVSRGIVSGHHHDFSDDEPVYLLDAASGSGSSGGPVTDRSGNLVGVATAVYDTRASDELGFAWCFAIPASHVRALFDERGELRSTPPTVSIDDLVRRVRGAPEGPERVQALGEALASIARTRTKTLELAGDCVQLLERVSGSISLDSEAAGRQFMEVMVAQGKVITRRGAELRLGGDAPLEDPTQLSKLVQLDSQVRSIGHEMMSRSLARLDKQRQEALVLGMLEAVSAHAEESCRELSATSTRLLPLAGADPQATRGTSREVCLSALSELIMTQLILDMATRLPRLSESELQEVPPRVRTAFRRVRKARDELDAAWNAVPEAVRALVNEPAVPAAGADAVRSQLRTDGFTLVQSPETIQLSPDGAIRALQIRASEQTRAIAFLATSVGDYDIDLELLSPRGQLVATDRESDGYPLVGAQEPIEGVWTLRLLNPGRRTTSVRLEIWESKDR
jgi:S1-C subfamily serine protease